MFKTLATCKPSEFLVQTNRIRKSVERWLAATDIMNIRRRLPELEIVDKDAPAPEKAAVVKRNADAKREQVKKNLSAMLDAILDEHPAETLELLALCCFVEPENVDDYPMKEYISAITELINDEVVLDFFISLARLGNSGIFGTANK